MKKIKKTRQEINEASRLLKRQKKHKGRPSGSRHGEPNHTSSPTATTGAKDPRIGSKTPIALVPRDVEGQEDSATHQPNTSQIVPPKEQKGAKIKVSYEEELTLLEEDAELEHLLDLIEQDQPISAKQQHYVDSKLDRIEELMTLLGYIETDDDDLLDNTGKENIVNLLKNV